MNKLSSVALRSSGLRAQLGSLSWGSGSVDRSGNRLCHGNGEQNTPATAMSPGLNGSPVLRVQLEIACAPSLPSRHIPLPCIRRCSWRRMVRCGGRCNALRVTPGPYLHHDVVVVVVEAGGAWLPRGVQRVLSSGGGRREAGRGAGSRSRRGPVPSRPSKVKVEGRGSERTRTRPVGSAMALRSRGADRPCESGVVIDLTSSGDERSGVGAGRAQVTKQRGDNTAGGSNTSQQSLPNTPRPRRPVRVENPADSTPNFRSAAAMAGWDDETLLMLAVGQESPAASLRLNQAPGVGSSEGPSRAASCPDTCAGCLQCRERKRRTRTSGQAATPLSAARRRRRARRMSSNEEPLEPIRMAMFNDGEKCVAQARKSEDCSKQQASEDKENQNPQPCSRAKSVKDSAQDQTSKNDALQLDQLREELTCVVCLDICFEPSTISCGHSFCRGCLQSVYQKCGMRCPKCRQELRATSKNDCPINTVLWNTIQLLFPKETAARLEDQKKTSEKYTKPDRETMSRAMIQAELQLLRARAATRISRPTPWRNLTTARGTERLGPNVGSLTLSRGSERLRLTAGNLTSFRRASVVLELGQSTLGHPTGRVDGYQQMRGRRPTGSSSHSRGPQVLRQEEEDAALAARLQESFLLEAGL